MTLTHHRPFCRTSFRQRGFTIVEVMTATMILAISIIGSLVIVSRSMVLLQTIRDFSRANQILQQQMEDVRLLSHSAIQSGTFTDPSDPGGRFRGTMTVQQFLTDPDGEPQSVKVTLAVTWKGRGGRDRTQTLTSVFTRGGLNEYIF